MRVSSELISRCVKNDERAQHELFKLSYSTLIGVCLRYYKNESDAHAALNKGFYRILSKIKQHDQSKSFESWAKKVLINSILNDLKLEKSFTATHILTEMDDMEFDTILSVRDIDESTDADAILELLSRLPMNEQRVFNLFAIDGYSHKEISAILKIPEGTSKWLLSTARKKMADSLIKIVRKGFALVV